MENIQTSEELKVLDTLAIAWNLFEKLPQLHPWDKQEFMHSIHSLQRIIMARPAMRQENSITKSEPYPKV